MDFIKQQITEWLKEILVGGIMNNLSGMFDNVNSQVGQIASQVGTTPQAWNTDIYNMIRTLSENVMMPITGLILAFVMTLDLIQIITDKNNFHEGVCCKRCISNTSNTTRMTAGTFMVICLNYCVKSGDVLTD